MRKVTVICAFVVFVSLLQPGIAVKADCGEWPCYMMNLQHNAVVPSDCTINPANVSLLWTNKPQNIETDGRSIESPAAYKDGFVYFGRCDSMAHQAYTSKLIKAEATTGKVTWEFVIDTPNPSMCDYEFFVSGLSSSPLLFDDKIFLGAVNGDMYCLTQSDGSLVWKIKKSVGLPDKNTDLSRLNASYIRSSGLLYEGRILQPITRMSYDYKNHIRTAFYEVLSIDPATGKSKLLVSTEGYYFDKQTKEYIKPYDCGMRSSLAISDDKLYFGTTIELYCYDLKAKKRSWGLAGNNDHPFFCTPTIVDDKVYYGGPDKDFYCLNTDNGDVIWSSNSKLSIRNSSTPLISNNRAYIPQKNGKLVCLSDKGEKIDWTFECNNKNDAICSSPVLCGQYLWFGTNDYNLYCLDASTGKVIKKFELDGSIIAPPTIIDGKIFIGTTSGTMYCFGDQAKQAPQSITPADNNSWPCFMGSNEHNAVAPDSAAPKSFPLEKHWTFQAGFRILPQFVIANGIGFIGAQDNTLHAVKLEKGWEAWRYDCGEKCHHDKTIKNDALKYGGVNSTAAYADGKLFFGTMCYKIICVDASNGQQVWEYEDSDRDEGFNAPILYNNNKIYTTSSERLYCIDAKTGKKIWIANVWDNKMSPPTIAEGKLYVASNSKLLCLNPETGEEIIKDGFKHEGKKITLSCPSYKDGKIYFGCDDSDVFCFDAKTGKEIWRARNHRAITCAALTDDKMMYGDIFSSVTCLERSTGKELWQFKVGDFVYGAPVYCAGKLYFGAMNGTFYCIDTERGKEVWKYSIKEGSQANTGEKSIAASPTIFDGKVYISGIDGNLHCFGEVRKGLILDKVKITSPASFVMTNGKIQFTATALAKDGSSMDKKITWTSSPTEMGTVDQTGLFWAGSKTGYVEIKATCENVSDTARITIKDVKDIVASVAIAPQSTTLLVDRQEKFTAVALDGSGNPLEGVQFTWKVDPAWLGTVEDGIFTATKQGSGKVTATIGARSASAKIKVIKPSLIKIDPQNAVVVSGMTQQFKATVYNDLDEKIPDLQLSWSVEPATLGIINSDGLFTAGEVAGEGKIKVAFEGLEAEALLMVTGKPTGKMEVTPENLDFGKLEVGQSKTLRLTIRNSGDANITAEMSSDVDWAKLSTASVTLDAGDSKTIDVTANAVSMPTGANSGKITIQAGEQSLTANIRIVVTLPKNCITTNIKQIQKDVEENASNTTELELKTETGRPLPVTIESTNPRLSLSLSNATLTGEATRVSAQVNAEGLKTGEKIEGKIIIAPTDPNLCQAVEIPFSFQVKTASIEIWLQLNNPTAKINGAEVKLSAAPQLVKGSTMVPIRFIAEAFGCKVDWNGDEKKITITRGSFEMILWMDKTTAKINGKDTKLSAPPTSIKGSTFVPLRFIAEAFGATVDFNAATKEIKILWIPQK
ncbi:MAG: PQQ-binding-like beta-propeller repeat protein [Caldisericia bacterium]|nr:PQQ-binding-like beta-propeller repeat protein [Caldisericia bacterium]